MNKISSLTSITLVLGALLCACTSTADNDQLKDNKSSSSNGAGGVGGGKNSSSANRPSMQAVETTVTPELDFQESQITRFYQDGDSTEDITTLRYELASMVQGRATSITSFEIINFTPVDLSNVTVLLSIVAGPQGVHLAHLRKIPAHSTVEVEYPFLRTDDLYVDSKGKTVDLSEYNQTGIWKDDATFTFEDSNGVLQDLQAISASKWSVRVTDYNTDTEKVNLDWALDPTPREARLYSAFLINLAYLMADERMKAAYIAEPLNTTVIGLFDEATKEKQYEKILAKWFLGVGVRREGIAHSGGKKFGISLALLQGHLGELDNEEPLHELGHRVGFDHKSNITAPRKEKGFAPAAQRVIALIQKDGGFPITLENYYHPEDLK